MVTATVNFYGVIKQLVESPRATVILPDEFSLQDLVDALEGLYGRRMKEAMVSAGGYLNSHVRIFANGEDLEGALSQRFGPFEGRNQLDIYFVPMTEGGRD